MNFLLGREQPPEFQILRLARLIEETIGVEVMPDWRECYLYTTSTSAPQELGQLCDLLAADPLEHGVDAQIDPRAAHLILFAARQRGKPGIGKAHNLEPTQAVLCHRQPVAAHAFFGLDNLADAGKEPWIKRRGREYLVI